MSSCTLDRPFVPALCQYCKQQLEMLQQNTASNKMLPKKNAATKQQDGGLSTRLLLQNNSYEYLFRALSALQGWSTSCSRAVVSGYIWPSTGGHTSCMAINGQIWRHNPANVAPYNFLPVWLDVHRGHSQNACFSHDLRQRVVRSSADSADHLPYIAPSSVAYHCLLRVSHAFVARHRLGMC